MKNTFGVPSYFVLTRESFSALRHFTTQPRCALIFASEVTHPEAADGFLKKKDAFNTLFEGVIEPVAGNVAANDDKL